MYSSPATIAALAPFILGLARGSAVGGPRELSRDVSLNLASPAMSLGGGVDCYPYSDAECYKKYWEEFSRCHPYDKSCYKDCNDYDEYTNHCKNYDPNYGKCYDRCHYDDDNCEKYEGCSKDDDSCYRKKKREDTCHRDDDGCRQRHSYPPDFCKPWDWDCHKKQHGGEDYQCHPGSDKNCYPDYPDYPNYSDLEDDEPHQPQAHVQVVYAGEEGSFEQQVWPDGDEAWTDRNDFVVNSIKYYVKEKDKNVFCLPMKSWIPWTPLPIGKYEEKVEEDGQKVRVLNLKDPMPVELIRCDFP